MASSNGTKAAKFRADGWANVLTGMGIRNRDRKYSTGFASENPLDRKTLESIYRFNGLGRRIVDLQAQEMTREWISIKGDPELSVVKYFENFDAKNQINKLIRWARLYGGALAVIGIDDGRELDEPLNEESNGGIRFLRVYDRFQSHYLLTDLYSDPTNPKYSLPEFYRIYPISGLAEFRVHESRIIRLQGEDVPERIELLNQGWGDSVLQSSFHELRNIGTGFWGAATVVENFVQGVLKMNNLADLLAAGQEEDVIKRLNMIDLSRGVLNTILIDENEEYSRDMASITGLSDVLDKMMQHLSSVTGIPQTLLFGRSPAGLNSTGESDIQNWYDQVKAEQNDKLRPILRRLSDLSIAANDFNGNIADDYEIEFNPLWQRSDEEEAALRKTVAEADKIYIESGVLDPAEVAISRFGGDSYSVETKIDTETRNMPSEMPGDRESMEGTETEEPETVEAET